MSEKSIVKRMAKFIERTHATTNSFPEAIVITEAQLEELCAETGTDPSTVITPRFWGVPLIVNREAHVSPSIQSH
jgi:hypothetical protein